MGKVVFRSDKAMENKYGKNIPISLKDKVVNKRRRRYKVAFYISLSLNVLFLAYLSTTYFKLF